MAAVFEKKHGELQEFQPQQLKFEIVNSLDALWEYFKQTPNNTQLEDCADLIMETHPAMDITLFKLAITRIKTAHYGNDSKAFGQLTPQVVMHVIGLVWNEHENYLETQQAIAKERYNNGVTGVGAREVCTFDEEGNVIDRKEIVTESALELIDPNVISRFIDQRQRAMAARESEKDKVLMQKIDTRLVELAKVNDSIEEKKADAVERALEYLRKHEPEEYQDFINKLEDEERKHGLR